MKITVNREEPVPPPVKSITVEFSVSELRYIKYLAVTIGALTVTAGPAADRLYNKLNALPELNIPVNYGVF